MRTRIGWLCAAVVLSVAGPAAAAPKWEAFGNAEAVKVAPGGWAVALTSDADLPFGGIAYEPKKGLTLSDIKRLSADINGDYAAGSPRFQINVLLPDGTVRNVFVYLGEYPNYVGTTDGWLKSGNLVTSEELRWDTTQVGGTFYDDYEGAVELVGDLPVVGIQLVVDSGWFFEDGTQTVLVDNVRVNNDVMSGKNFKD
jgi:hypothetical protein